METAGDDAVGIFFLTFFLTNIVFSVILCSLLVRLNRHTIHANTGLLLHSLGLGPVFTTLILYYAFLLVPHHSRLFYLGLVGAVYAWAGILGRKWFGSIWRDVVNGIKRTYTRRASGRLHTPNIILSLVLGLPLVYFLAVYLTEMLPQPLIARDILCFGSFGRELFAERSLAPAWNTHFAESGFVYTHAHAPSFALLLTWEELVNSLFKLRSDFYFKSITAYYGLLLVGIQYYLVAKQNKWLALLSSSALVSGLGFFLYLFLPKHLDMYRMFFFCISWIYLVYAIRKRDRASLFLLGMFSGFAAFAHRIGVVLAVINWMTFVIFYSGKLNSRMRDAFILGMYILLFGADHYLFDLLWGSGRWILIPG